ncbi:hypothetical protein [Rossellomorea marisflavi]|uniref:hypothetical protein n=1 Tax=Rossellomorea marisflavi TaxID=189381 RepID=UPI002079929B|nr:hypothetical protein [Rossellomorea marisflavi]USK93634.1 hypothetical protein LIT29_07850 [Rossellomorea marisflavi]
MIGSAHGRSVPLRPAAFRGEGVEPPRACGVSIIPLFPSEWSGLRCTALLVVGRW